MNYIRIVMNKAVQPLFVLTLECKLSISFNFFLTVLGQKLFDELETGLKEFISCAFYRTAEVILSKEKLLGMFEFSRNCFHDEFPSF